MESATDTEARVIKGSSPEHSDSSIISHCLEDHSEGVEFPDEERAEGKDDEEKDAEPGITP